ncbi:hypothetical protein PTTG_05999 [Puccinia triticina 1-1 BBBD Race 1]|uniref:Transcription activator of gluconeogenesis ERT1 n=2 Tax=Puccinia triticina TaxID=208348 RepID=A0A180GA12_PUCT1|nr:uncharacterized protein PtA15_3A639 [Puccinia triticina]OAV89450.1 hypothetical protein PTTG_05999 [Puccinia triticina 1-1 BBBD Race 1]WAQ83270.1 hypothetical protein PtA15_3A639 [Puccinia triticina]WAR54118.1 hypothetical protein PtB15_3B630 [Puccinia triticina]
MSHSRYHKSLYDAETPETMCPRPTLPSLRSQVGEYLPESSTSSHPDFHHSYYHHNTGRPSESGSRRLSISSSSLTSASAHRSSMIRTPSTDGRRYGSSATINAHPTLLPSSPGNASAGMNTRHPSISTSTHVPPVTATRSTVSVACTNCRSAHLACSDGRPCRRCLQTGRAATCIDVEPKKRGRPRASDITAVGVTSMMQELSTDGPNGPHNESEDLVIIMSTSLRCARLTSSLVQTLGHPLKTVLEQPFSSFIHPDEKQEYARFSIGLLTYPGVTSRPVPVSATRLHQVSMLELTGRLSGAAVHTHIFRLRGANNKWIPFKFEAYLGSAFGAHPSDPESLRHTYVVLRLSPVGRMSRNDIRSPSSSNSSSHSMTDSRREGSVGMSYYGQGSSSSRSTSRARDHPGNRQSFGGYYDPAYDNCRPPSRSGLF